MFSICPSLQPYLEVKWRFHHPDSYSQPSMQSKWSLLLNHQFRGVGTNGPTGPSEFFSPETKGKAAVEWSKAPISLYMPPQVKPKQKHQRWFFRDWPTEVMYVPTPLVITANRTGELSHVVGTYTMQTNEHIYQD